MFRNNIHGIILIFIVSAALPFLSGKINVADYRIHHNPKQYVPDKYQSHELVLLGTMHKGEQILQFISHLSPVLSDAGGTHICLEIYSDQQDKIEHFAETGAGLMVIEIHSQMTAHPSSPLHPKELLHSPRLNAVAVFDTAVIIQELQSPEHCIWYLN